MRRVGECTGARGGRGPAEAGAAPGAEGGGASTWWAATRPWLIPFLPARRVVPLVEQRFPIGVWRALGPGRACIIPTTASRRKKGHTFCSPSPLCRSRRRTRGAARSRLSFGSSSEAARPPRALVPMFSSGTKQLENQLFQLKFTAKQLGRLSKKCEKDEKAEKTKIKKAMEKNNYDGARIHAQNAIRNKSNAQNYLRLSSRVYAVSSRLESAMKMQQARAGSGEREPARAGPAAARSLDPSAARPPLPLAPSGDQVDGLGGEGHGQGARLDERRGHHEGDGLFREVVREHGRALGVCRVGDELDHHRHDARGPGARAARPRAARPRAAEPSPEVASRARRWTT